MKELIRRNARKLDLNFQIRYKYRGKKTITMCDDKTVLRNLKNILPYGRHQHVVGLLLVRSFLELGLQIEPLQIGGIYSRIKYVCFVCIFHCCEHRAKEIREGSQVFQVCNHHIDSCYPAYHQTIILIMLWKLICGNVLMRAMFKGFQ